MTGLEELKAYIERSFKWFIDYSPDHGVIPLILKKINELIEKEKVTSLPPIDAMLNLIGYIDTPVGRKLQHPDIVSQVQELRKWTEKLTNKTSENE